MKIGDLFVKPVNRPIEGVIKADDDRHLQTELEEYVVTGEVAKGLSELIERYLDETNSNGVWISGFFGSGKSHLLKILSLVLENRTLPGGAQAADILLSRIDDEFLKADLQKALKIPSRSILFNIDQKSDAIGGDRESPVLEVFVKVLNELQGYYSKQGHIAQFEYDLDLRRELEAFKETYAEVSGRTWEADLPVMETLENETFAKAYAKFFGKSYEEGLKLFDRQRDGYKVSSEDFAKRVRAYLDKQGPDFRVNFFADEVGQFIGQDSRLMLTLQTIAESLATICEGRAWVFVTSQGDLKKVLGELRKGEGDDFTKIQGRFKTRLTLTSADVREVIQKRLLAKTEEEPEALAGIYDVEKENLQTIFRFGDGSVQYRTWRGSDEFCDFYPFVPYQFDLFQRAIEQLSRHEAFTGKHTAVGERSMLAVFQEVAKTLIDQDVGALATFDRMFDGLSASLRGDFQTSIRQAQKQLDDPVAIDILKALFLLKWVREFKPTTRNVAILLVNRPDIDIQAHEQAVREALTLLEQQSYLQRSADVYEFLTDAEKDIEVEIKNTDIDESEQTKLLADVFFADILRDPKIRYEANGQDYAYTRRLDDQLVGREADFSINLITSEHPNHDDLYTLAAQNTGRAELLVALPGDGRVIDDARLYLKTRKYIQHNTGGGIDEVTRDILSRRGQQNGVRRTQLQERCSELMSKAALFVNGSRLNDIPEGDPRTRLQRGGQALIAFTYPSLRMLRGTYDEALLTKTLLEPDDLLGDGACVLAEAEQEVLTYVLRAQKDKGERLTIEDMVRDFGRRPYGWPQMATLVQVARLFRLGKVELRTNEILDAKAVLDALKSSRQHGTVRIRIQDQFDPSAVAALKAFHHDFFDRANDGTDARSAAQLTLSALAGEAEDIQLLVDQKGAYPFVGDLEPIGARIEAISEKDYTYLLRHLDEFRAEFLTAKDDLIAPIKAFMRGKQRTAYDQVVAFLGAQQANFSEVPDEALEPLRAVLRSEAPYRGGLLPVAKASMEQVKAIIMAKLDEERERALLDIDAAESKIATLPDYDQLDEAQQAQVLQKCRQAREAIAAERFVSGIRDRLSRYHSFEYPAQLALVARLAASGAGDDERDSEVQYVPASSLNVDCGLPYISGTEEIRIWLDALEAAALDELAKGNRISL
jgi:Family of unknown function (DUF6079)